MISRSKYLARVHILRKELALSDEDYRAVLLRGFGVRSAKDLADEDLSQAVATFEGMVCASRRQETADPGNHSKASKRIWAQWYQLKTFLSEGKRGADYLCGIARRNAPDLAVVNGKLDFDSCSKLQADRIYRSLIHAVQHEKEKMAEVPF